MRGSRLLGMWWSWAAPPRVRGRESKQKSSYSRCNYMPSSISSWTFFILSIDLACCFFVSYFSASDIEAAKGLPPRLYCRMTYHDKSYLENIVNISSISSLNSIYSPSNRTSSIRMLSSTTTPGLTGKRSKSSLLLKSCRPAHWKSKSQFIIFILSDSLLVVEAWHDAIRRY